MQKIKSKLLIIFTASLLNIGLVSCVGTQVNKSSDNTLKNGEINKKEEKPKDSSPISKNKGNPKNEFGKSTPKTDLKKSSVEQELRSNNELLAAQEKFNYIKNRIIYFEKKRISMPYIFYFQEDSGPNGMPSFLVGGAPKLDKINSYISKINIVTKENYKSTDFESLVNLFDDVDKKVKNYDDSNEKPTVIFESVPDSLTIKNELIKEIESLKNRQYFMEKYNTKENIIKIEEAYKIYWDILTKEYYKYPYLSVGSAATVNFSTKNNNLFTFSASSNKLTHESKKSMANYVDEAILLLSEGMSVYDKVFVLTRFVDDKLNYMFKSEGLNDAYTKFWGVCKEYVEQAAILYSIAGLEFRIITGEQHIWFTFKNEEGKWFIVDPTHLDPGKVDVDYPPVFQGSAKLISDFKTMFKYEKHLNWDTNINGLDASLLNEVNNNISKEESESIFNNFIDPLSESDYHFYKGHAYFVKNGKLVSLNTKNKVRELKEITFPGLENDNLENLLISYKNVIFIIKNSNSKQKIYSYNLEDKTVKFIQDLPTRINDLEYLFNDGKIKVTTKNDFSFEINVPNDANVNSNYSLKLKLKSLYVKFGLFFTENDSNYQSLKEKLGSLESQEELNTSENINLLSKIERLIKEKIS
ncbi:putative lipoprotein [Mycoplasmopsis canis UFG4]|uniref:Putative lipoprotein n=1 Tax=Mycoplasmopsis canis UFG4 TaxID=1131455 RepID=I1A6P1_9BACT|nr:hypothetical protein [Mycoplasmopsis canis]EIE42162.1 putative lipoprotein [Mycoplasmopsis canis UFG4]